MTEIDWWACADPDEMLDFVRGGFLGGLKRLLTPWPGRACNQTLNRKLQLFACACCRGIWPLLADERSRQGVEISERFALGLAGKQEFLPARAAAWTAAPRLGAAGWAAAAATWGSSGAAGAAGWAATAVRPADAEQRQQQCDILRDLFGNPFRPIAVDPTWVAWNDRCVPNLVRAISRERRFGDLPILADALQDAACTNEDILTHCRSGGEHVRGCWVLDALVCVREAWLRDKASGR